MIFKEFDSKQDTLNTLNKLLNTSSSEKQKALITKDINLLKSGIEAEKQNAYYMDFYLKDSKNLIVLHDIRLDYDDRTAQIDHMLISRFGVELFESKSFKGQVTINEDNSFDVLTNNKIKSYPSPLEQSKRHANLLKKFIETHANLGKRIELLGGFEIKSIVLIHPETTITNKQLPENFYRADTYISKRLEDIDKMGVFEVFKFASKMTDIGTAKELANLIKASHKPLEFDYTNKYRISIKEEPLDIPIIKDKEEIKNTPLEKQEPTSSKPLKEGDICPFCTNKLVLRQGKNSSPFLGCSSFPKCRFTRKIAKVAV